MAQPEVYAWDADINASCNMIISEFLAERVFVCGEPIEDSLDRYRFDFERIHTKSEFDILCKKNTEKWAKDHYPIPCTSTIPKETLASFDVTQAINFVPAFSDRVCAMMQDFCPNDFESFPISIKTPTGTLDGFQLINITHRIYHGLDLPRCNVKASYLEREPVTWMPILDKNKKCMRHYLEKQDIIKIDNQLALGEIKKEFFDRILFRVLYTTLKPNVLGDRHMGRLAEKKRWPMFSQRLIDKFKEMDVKGFLYTTYEEQSNCLYGGIIPS